MSSFSTPISALDAFSTGFQVGAHNIANINTDNFNASRTTFSNANNGVEAQVQNSSEFKQINNKKLIDESLADEAIDFDLQTHLTNNVQLEQELTNSIIYSNAFDANAQTIQTQDEMLGTIINMKA